MTESPAVFVAEGEPRFALGPLARFLTGFLEFRRDHLPELAGKFRTLAKGQSPDTLFIACSDSRLVPNMLTGSDPGEMFVVRSVGNLIAPAAPSGVSLGDVSEASAIEYAVEILRVSSIIVCGHSSCGAMQAVLRGRKTLTQTPNLAEWLRHAEPACARLAATAMFSGSKLPEEDRLSQMNVLQQMDHVKTYPLVLRAIAEERLLVVGAWFDIRTADLHLYDPSVDKFLLLDERQVERLLGVA